MRNLLAFVGAAVVAFLGLGWYLGWYSVTSQKAPEGQSRLQVDINKQKIGEDVKKGADNVQDFIEKARQNQGGSETSEPKQGAKLEPPTTDPKSPPNTTGASSRAKDALGNFIVDGWFSGDKK